MANGGLSINLQELVLFYCPSPRDGSEVPQVFGQYFKALSLFIGPWSMVFISFMESPQGS